MKVILEPNLREVLETSADIPGPISKTIDEFKDIFPNFDYSRINLES